MAQDDGEPEDPRINYMKYVTLQSLNIDSGPWEDMIWKEENVTTIKEFLNIPTSKMLLAYLDRGNKLLLSITFPLRPPMPNVITYFIKHKNEAISAAEYKQEIMCGNFTNLTLEDYNFSLERILTPLLCNPSNNEMWPAEIRYDIALHMKMFQKIVSYCMGLSKGKTVLPIPEIAKTIENYDISSLTKDSLSDWQLRLVLDAISDMIIDWNYKVNEFLEQTPEQILRKEKDQGPATEVSFWKNRRENLLFMQKQVSQPCVKQMLLALEKLESNYLSSLRKLLQDIAEGLYEADDIFGCLQMLSSKLIELESCPFSDLITILPVAMQTITDSWAQSAYFSSVPSRVCVLMEKICNLLIQKVQDLLVPESLFKEDKFNSGNKIKTSLSVLDAFIASYYKCENQIESQQEHKLYPWGFPDQRVFKRLEEFISRLHEVQNLFDAVDVYFQIPNIKIPKVQHAVLKAKLKEIVQEFCEIYKTFEKNSYNPLDLQCEQFDKDYKLFCEILNDLDYRLGAAIGLECRSCYFTNDAYKLMEILEPLITRSLVNEEFRTCIPHFIDKINAELIEAKATYDKQINLLAKNGKGMTYKNLPPIAGALQWATDLLYKISLPVSPLKNIERYFVTSHDAYFVYKIYEEMTEHLTKFQDDIFETWVKDLDLIDELLSKPLFVRNENNYVQLNFDLKIFEIAEEIRYQKMKKLKELPSKAVEFDAMAENMLTARSYLSSITRWYNDLLENLVPFEKNLISDQWEDISSTLENGEKETWKSEGLLTYAESFYNKLKDLFENVYLTKKNIQEVQQYIETWNKEPMYIRDVPSSVVDFKIFMNTRVKNLFAKVRTTAEKMEIALKENLKLFKCDAATDTWENYIKYLETIIETGLKENIRCSLQYLFDNTNPENKLMDPFYMVFMTLEEDIVFIPAMVSYLNGSLHKFFDNVLKKIYSLSSEIKRMSDSETDYLSTINNFEELKQLKSAIKQHVRAGTLKVLEAAGVYEPYADFWLEDMTEILEEFVLYGPAQNIGEGEEEIEYEQLELNPPSEEEFRTKIADFELMHRQIEDMKPLIHAETWLLLDTSMFKEKLLVIIRNWIFAYKRKLIEQKSQGKLKKIEDED